MGKALGVFALASIILAGTSNDLSVAGFVTDTWCGRRGANARHAEHARRTVASGVAQYALYDETTKRLYILEPQATAAQYAGQRVKITGTLGTTPLTRAGQSYAPDAVAGYKDSSAPSGFRASGATSGSSTAPGTIQTATPTAARSTAAKVQSHEDALDQTTPIAGTLTIASIAADPIPLKRRTSRKR